MRPVLLCLVLYAVAERRRFFQDWDRVFGGDPSVDASAYIIDTGYLDSFSGIVQELLTSGDTLEGATKQALSPMWSQGPALLRRPVACQASA